MRLDLPEKRPNPAAALKRLLATTRRIEEGGPPGPQPPDLADLTQPKVAEYQPAPLEGEGVGDEDDAAIAALDAALADLDARAE